MPILKDGKIAEFCTLRLPTCLVSGGCYILIFLLQGQIFVKINRLTLAAVSDVLYI